MNKIWTTIILLSLLFILFTNPSELLPSLISASNSSLSLCFELLAIYAIWLGILNIIENTKLNKFISKLLSPIIDLFWGKSINKKAKSYLSLSLSTSVLGIGGASIPYGIKAIENMQENNSKVVNFPMIMTIVFASSGIQILPTTIMGLITASGGKEASFVILPTLLASLSTTIVGVSLCLLFEKISNKFKRKKQI